MNDAEKPRVRLHIAEVLPETERFEGDCPRSASDKSAHRTDSVQPAGTARVAGTDTLVMGQIGVADLERRLGSDRLDVRLGAIDALERIMTDSARDHPAIVELLAAFVRECAPAAASGPDLDAGGQPERHPRPPADSQVAVTVLARRPAGRTERGPVNLAGAHLAGANLLHANLPGAVLAGAHLAGANLFHANLPGAVLAGAHLAGANLFHADLAGADLSCADLTRADLGCANLARATLAGSNLTLVNLTLADLTGADLTDADLTEAALDGADLPGVTLTREQQNAINTN